MRCSRLVKSSCYNGALFVGQVDLGGMRGSNRIRYSLWDEMAIK